MADKIESKKRGVQAGSGGIARREDLDDLLGGDEDKDKDGDDKKK